jgi:hypothetical protein
MLVRLVVADLCPHISRLLWVVVALPFLRNILHKEVIGLFHFSGVSSYDISFKPDLCVIVML